jgi:hypothetical protein
LIERVSALELLLDLVLVFTLTQLTAVLEDDPDPLQLGSPALRSLSARLARPCLVPRPEAELDLAADRDV